MNKVCYECRHIIYGKSYKIKDEDGLEYWVCETCMENAFEKEH